MRAFEVYLNRKKLCVAGVGDDGVLSAITNWVTRSGTGDLFLQVGGLLSLADEHVSWIRQRRLRVGDRIEIRIVETDSVDKPKRKRHIDPAERLRSEKRYVRNMAKQLGWKIQAKAK